MDYDDDHDEDEEEEIGLPQQPQDGGDFRNSGRLKMLVPVVSGDSSGSGKRIQSNVRYKECLKNHAVSIGGHAIDGCGEFMAAGEEGTLESLKCAACNCHRNFHRKEAEGEIPAPQFAAYYRGLPPPASHGPAGYLHVGPSRQSALAITVREEQEEDGVHALNPMGKKRFRTKFTQEQKDKMLAFAEKVGWRIQKQDEAEVQRFCMEACIKRHVLKVWMHNNKHTLGKKQHQQDQQQP
ncbi:hypothetical protein AMTRI_Chr01g128880 [Amborella trichopoda]|uniref:ZF-HD dimerization-type domain-containing protein n=1 Tax=Amborella trichopoda TaxID=13333 RepID=U5CZE1_AMBTC|nr:zinc-finger homeodomain protein 2 [Amborella trichopoda]ERN14507.1 hypothetical protein AMTR_s00038p00027320 [Amborella trichopoda]|eukprot:XP_006853040.1 zinc-finger homeodomain protein 2 [Amborella trichopoda]